VAESRPPGAGKRPSREPPVVGGTDRPLRLTGSAEGIRVPIDRRARRSAVGAETPHRVLLDLEHVDAERNPGTVYGVYVNLPANPSPDDLRLHHVGNVSLFGIERVRAPKGDHSHGAMRISMDITGVLARLRENGRTVEADQLDVSFRPIDLVVSERADKADELRAELRKLGRHPETPVSIGRIAIRME
jgi:tyrosinase